MSHRGYAKNEDGTRISVHVCGTCEQIFTLCPAVAPEDPGWDHCMDRGCDSYDVDRDVDLMFEIEP